MKKAVKKFRLNRETLRVLEDNSVSQVAGGDSFGETCKSCVCFHVTNVDQTC